MVLLLCLSASAGAPCGAAAQVEVRPGQRVKMTIRGQSSARYIGTLQEIRSDTLFLETSAGRGAVLPLPLHYIESVDLSAGRKRHPLKGALVGAAVLAVPVAISFHRYDYCEDRQQEAGTWACIDLVGWEFAAFMGAILGAPPGALIGYLLVTEKWVRAQLPVSVEVGTLWRPHGSPGLALRFRRQR